MWQWAPIRDWLIAQITEYWATPLLTAVQIGIVMVSLILVMAFYTLAERKVDRLDPGAQGPEPRQSPVDSRLAQPFADVFKLMFKKS